MKQAQDSNDQDGNAKKVNFTPFAVFLADAHTMYVTDEGTGSSTDSADHAGLENWSLVGRTWQLDYALRNTPIGAVDSNLTGDDGQYPDVNTVGLRNLTGVVNLVRPRSHSALPSTEAELRLMTRAASIGNNRIPNTGSSSPVTTGTPSPL